MMFNFLLGRDDLKDSQRLNPFARVKLTREASKRLSEDTARSFGLDPKMTIREIMEEIRVSAEKGRRK